MLRPVRIFAAVLVLLAGPAWAADPGRTDLYTARVPMTGADPAARDQAVARALAVVVQRLAPHVPDAPAVARRLRDQAPALMASARADGGALEVRFDAPAVHAALRNAGVQAWGEPRPRVLVWLVFDSGETPELLGADSPLAGELARAGERYGVGLDLALLDADERAAVSAGTVIRLDWEALAATSVRYAPDAFGALLLSDDGARLRARLNLTLPDGETVASTPAGDTLDAVLDAAAHDLAAQFARHDLGPAPAAVTAPDAGRDAPAATSASAPAPVLSGTDAVERPRVPSAGPPAGTRAPGPFVVQGGPGLSSTTPSGLAATGAAAPPAGAGSTPLPASAGPAGTETAAAPVTGPAETPAGSVTGATAPGLAPAMPTRAPVAAAPLPVPPRASAADGVVVEVEGVHGAAAYQQVHAALRALTGVTGVRPLAAGSAALTLEVRYPDGAQALGRALAAGAPFDVLETGARDVRLRYRGP